MYRARVRPTEHRVQNGAVLISRNGKWGGQCSFDVIMFQAPGGVLYMSPFRVGGTETVVQRLRRVLTAGQPGRARAVAQVIEQSAATGLFWSPGWPL